MKPSELTGLELMQLLVEGKVPAPSIAKTIPMDFSQAKVTHGSISFTCTPSNAHLNPLGGVHGGFIATVLDSAASCAVHTTLDKGQGYGTIDLNIKMMRPLQVDTCYVVTGRIINRSKKLGISEAEIRASDGKIHAHATATCMLS